MKKDLSNMRENYKKGNLDFTNLNSNPFLQFQEWFDDAIKSNVVEPNAMTLSTVNSEGIPSSRIVLLKELNLEGFVFFTNYNSKKGKEIAVQNNVALNFFWKEVERQIQINGIAEKIDREQSKSYFHSRPFGSQVGAISSNQSDAVESREVLETRYASNFELHKEAGQVPYPDNWGGYVVKPFAIEFWQGRESRLHDRFKYTFENSVWTIKRLEP